MKTLLMTITLMILTNCGIDPEAYDTYKESQKEEREESTKESTDETSPKEETPAKESTEEPKTEVQVDVSTEVSVDVNVDVNVDSEDPEKPLKFKRGLTMDQVIEMFGEPDDVIISGAGLNWSYDNDDVCLEGVICSVWFDRDKKVRGYRDIRPELKDIRDL